MFFAGFVIVVAVISCALLFMNWGNEQALDVRKVLWTDSEMLRFLQKQKPKVVNRSISSTSIFSDNDILRSEDSANKEGGNMPEVVPDAGKR